MREDKAGAAEVGLKFPSLHHNNSSRAKSCGWGGRARRQSGCGEPVRKDNVTDSGSTRPPRARYRPSRMAYWLTGLVRVSQVVPERVTGGANEKTSHGRGSGDGGRRVWRGKGLRTGAAGSGCGIRVVEQFWRRDVLESHQVGEEGSKVGQRSAGCEGRSRQEINRELASARRARGEYGRQERVRKL